MECGISYPILLKRNNYCEQQNKLLILETSTANEYDACQDYTFIRL